MIKQSAVIKDLIAQKAASLLALGDAGRSTPERTLEDQ